MNENRKSWDIGPMLNPKSIAIIGASRDPDKVGHIILQNYIEGGFSGRLYPVNKNADGKILGLKAYKSVLGIKDKLDLAVVAVPAPFVPDVIEECGRAHVKTAIVVSGGFAEVGNTELQEKMVAIADKYGIALLGPNCLGVMNPRARVDTLFLPSYKLSRAQIGGVSFVAQSGAVGSTVLDLISQEGFGLSKFLSYGNAAQVDEVDILHYLMNDDETKVIVMYLEGIRRGKAFIEIARKITKIKPVIVLKAGKTAAGISAAHSHTASLAGSYAAHEAVFRQFGFTIANDISELIHYAKIFSTEPLPKGNKVAIITNGGGTGVMTADEISLTQGLTLAAFSNSTTKALQKVMPVLVNVRNPLDLAGDADHKRYSDALLNLASDTNVDMLVVIVLFQTPAADATLATQMIKIKETMNKPMIVISMGSAYTQMHKTMMESAGLPVYDSPASAALALEGLFDYGEYLKNKK